MFHAENIPVLKQNHLCFERKIGVFFERYSLLQKIMGIFLKKARHDFGKSSGAFFEMFGMNFWKGAEGAAYPLVD